MERPEINGLRCGDWEYDVLVTDTGSLMFTVYEKGKPSSDDETRCVDIVVDRNLDIYHF